LAAVLMFGAAWSLLINVANVLTPPAFSTQDLAYATNLANAVFGLGAFLTPLLLSFFLGRLSLTAVVSGVGLLTLLPALLTLGIDFAALTPGRRPRYDGGVGRGGR